MFIVMESIDHVFDICLTWLGLTVAAFQPLPPFFAHGGTESQVGGSGIKSVVHSTHRG